MATVTGTSLIEVDSVLPPGLTDPQGIATAEINGTTFVYVSGSVSDNIQVLVLSDDGTLTPVAQIEDNGARALNGAFGLETFTIGAKTFLAVASLFDRGVSVFELSDAGPYLTLTDTVFDSDGATLRIDTSYSVETVVTATGTFLYATGFIDDGLSAFSVDPNGNLSNLQNVADDATLELDGALGLHAFSRAGQNYIAVSGFVDDGISIFSVAADGTLTNVANYDAPVGLDGPWSPTSIEIDGTTYLYVPSQTSEEIIVLSFDGVMIEQVQSIRSQILDVARDAQVIQAGDRTLLAVSAEFGDGVEIFEIETNPLSGSVGQLTPAQSLPLGGATDTETVTVDGTTFLLASSDEGITAFELGGGDDRMTGTQSDDSITEDGGDDTIEALAGNDRIFIEGTGDDLIRGGSGDDAFSFRLFRQSRRRPRHLGRWIGDRCPGFFRCKFRYLGRSRL